MITEFPSTALGMVPLSLQEVLLYPTLILCLWPTLSQCSSITAWMAGSGPAVALQDSTTGDIIVSPCNIGDRVRFDWAIPCVFQTESKPKTGTSLAAKGWSPDGIPQVSIFFQDQHNTLAGALYACDSSAGRCTAEDDVEGILHIPNDSLHLHDATSLDLASLGGQETLLFYHNLDRSLEYLNMSEGRESALEALPAATVPTSMSLSVAACSGSLFVVVPENSESIALYEYGKGQEWKQTSSYPDSLGRGRLPGWTGDPGTLAAVTEQNNRLSIFYIGNDQALHHISRDSDGIWALQPDQPLSVWPLARQQDADFAIASSDTDLWIYYFGVGSVLKEAHRQDGEWLAAEDVSPGDPSSTHDLGTSASSAGDPPTPTATSGVSGAPPVGPSSTSTSTSTPITTPIQATPALPTTGAASNTTGECDHNCARQARGTGIAVGVTMGVAGLIMVAVAYFFFRSWKKKQAKMEEEERRFREWKPCQQPGLEHIRPYSSVGNLHWNEPPPHNNNTTSQAGGRGPAKQDLIGTAA